jgi:short-chain fatty acids transporter
MLAPVTRLGVRMVQRYMPDPLLYAVALTLVSFGLGWAMGPKGALELCAAWYAGVWKILEFAVQMALVLVAGHTMAQAPVFERGLAHIAKRTHKPAHAVALTLFLAMAASLLNWALGLVVAGLLAREMGRRVKGLDFGLVVAAAYSGFVVWASGLSSSIALVSATHGSKLNFIEQRTGHTVPLSHTLLLPCNVVPTLLLLGVLPLVFARIRPERVTELAAPATPPSTPPPIEAPKATAAARLEQSRLVTLALLAIPVGYVVYRARNESLAPDINFVIFVFLFGGFALHARPIRYIAAWNQAARGAGPLLLQYPLYGGILGLLSGSSLAEHLSMWAVAASSRRTFPLFAFLSSNLITLFVPSGGGHWAVQAPIVLPAAEKLGVAPAVVAMAVALGEQTANMVQPFWALPVLAIAGLGVRDIMGYCLVTLALSLVAYGAALLLLV